MHGYVRFCIFAWVVNNVVGPSQKRKRKIICTQTHANCVNLYNLLFFSIYFLCKYFLIYIYVLILVICFNKFAFFPLNNIIDLFKSYKQNLLT